MGAKVRNFGLRMVFMGFFICALCHSSLWAQTTDIEKAEKLLQSAVGDYDGARYELAEQQLGEAIKLCGAEKSLCEILHYYRALTRARLQRLPAALEDLATAISLLNAGEKLHYRFLQAEWQHTERQNAAALQTLEQLLPLAEQQKNDFLPDAYTLQGQLLLQQNKARPALAALNRALELRAELPKALYYRAFAFFAVGAPDKACADLQAAAQLGHSEAQAAAAKYCE